MAPLRLALLFLALAAAARAVEIRFVPAAAEGTVSLGIYDGSGKLVRVLCDEWPIGRFGTGLNGLSTEWDGKDSAGQPVPTGLYRARGFVVGAVAVEGEAFHFNDWIGTDDAPRIVSVAATGLLPDGGLLLAARMAGGAGALLRYDPQSTGAWKTLATEPSAPTVEKVKLAIASNRVFVLLDRRIRALDLASGKEIVVPEPAAEPADIAARGDRLALLAADSIKILGAADFAKRSELPLPPSRPVAFALLEGDTVVAAGEDGSLWLSGPQWKRLETPPDSKVSALAAGRGNTFWALERKGDAPPVVVQYSPEEGRLAEWLSPVAGRPGGLAASTEVDYFAATFTQPASERTVAIRRRAGEGWELAADKTITASSSFGWADDKLAPASGELPDEITGELKPNPLDPSGPRSLVLRAGAVGGGTGLVAGDGLPLVRVSEEPGFTRLMVLPGFAPGTARFYQGDVACVEQYNLVNLGDITAFDAGSIEMEGGVEKAPPPEEDPETARP